ncbi:MAG TPA: DivIVA domain-containing protein [Bacillota bacterium]|nr:DivIVA domain-containing protein [Bacillota bacterium]
MVMSPLDVRNQEFNRAFRGYSEDEVDSFLEVLCEDYETLVRENISLKEQLSQKDESMWKYRDIEETLKSTLLLAQKTAEDVRSTADKDASGVITNANREAELVLKEAARKAEILIKEAEDKAQAIVEEYAGLQKQAQLFRANLRSSLQAQLDMLRDPNDAISSNDSGPFAVNNTSAPKESPELSETAFVDKDAVDVQQEVAVTKFEEPDRAARNGDSGEGVSEDTLTLILEPQKSSGDGFLKEPRYNPGNNQID